MGLSKKAKKGKNRHISPLALRHMPGVSNSSPLALRKDHDSSILSFLLYILLAGLFRSLLFPFQWMSCLSAKLKDLVGNTNSDPDVASLSDRDKFKMWCTVWLKTYPNKDEEERRFRIFQEALARPPTDIGFNRPSYADLTPAELEEIRRATGCSESYPVYISQSHFEQWARNFKASTELRRRMFEEWEAMYG